VRRCCGYISPEYAPQRERQFLADVPASILKSHSMPSQQDHTQILLITGPAGIGKSTVCWEIGAQLADAQVAHAIIETDELDRVFPKPSPAELEKIDPGSTDVSSINLAALWSTYRALGHTRLIMSGVMLHLNFDRQWILRAIPDATIIVVRLQASESTLLARLARREVGSSHDEQIQRTLRQARRMQDQQTEGVISVSAEGKTPQELAETILSKAGWKPF
jgi:uridine kinase